MGCIYSMSLTKSESYSKEVNQRIKWSSNLPEKLSSKGGGEKRSTLLSSASSASRMITPEGPVSLPVLKKQANISPWHTFHALLFKSSQQDLCVFSFKGELSTTAKILSCDGSFAHRTVLVRLSRGDHQASVREKGGDGEENLRDGQRKAPLILEDAKADTPDGVDVWII